MNNKTLSFTIRTLLHTQDGSAFVKIIHSTPYADIADALKGYMPEEVITLLLTLPVAERAQLFSHLPQAQQDILLPLFPKMAVINLFETLPSDDRADIYKRLDKEVQAELLPALARAEREDILKLAAYPENSVGSAITSNYATLSPNITVEEGLRIIRASAPDKETIYVIYVLDVKRRLLGTVSLRDLVLAKPDRIIGKIMRKNPVFAHADWPLQQATEMIRRYDLLAIPVVNGKDKMIGILTVDDAMDIEKEQDAIQLTRFGGVTVWAKNDLDIRASSFRDMFSVRVFWLSILTFFGIITSTFVARQSEILEQVIVLAAFIAPIVDMGGNTGSQSATLVIRGMALGDLHLNWRDIWFVIKKEIPVAIVLGLIISLLEVVLAYFSKGIGLHVLLVVGLSMLVCTTLGGIIGAVLPFLARRIGSDPATLSSPLITSIMDLLGVLVYFGFAYVFLGDMLRPALS